MIENITDYQKLYKDISEFKIMGVGEKTVKKLKSSGIKTIMDLFYYFPKLHEDRSNIKQIKDLKSEEYVVIKGKIINANIIKTRTRKILFKAIFSDGTGMIELIWFQMPYLKTTIKAGIELIIIGKVKKEYGLKIVNPEYRIVKEKTEVKGEIKSVYTSITGITQSLFNNILKDSIINYAKYLSEIIPESIMREYKLMSRLQAIRAIHFPKNNKELEEAKRRLAIEEILILEIGIMKKRFEIEYNNKNKYELDDKKKLVKNFLNILKFDLTGAQKRVITEIYKDFSKGKISNRLIQGDVGSGKTIVVMIMLLYMVENGYQGVFMAPTEILAVQHYLGIVDIMNNLGIKVEVLTGSIKGKKRERMLKEIEEGLIKIVVGTHALIEDGVKFKNLGLIVIDEQHRFGVMQRKRLREKGVLANLIVMSATPIPRSLALSIYGDLDVSIIDELPPGRTPIKTKWIKNKIELDRAYDFMNKKIKEGRQIYFVCPLIDESEKMNIKSVSQLYEELQNDIFKDYKIELLHGKMKSTEKDEVMREFKRGKIDILVSTTVIEVGVDVPNASVMVIQDAERFGLAQLHQLRGRVGRGEHPSYCFLISDSTNETSKQRLEVMEYTNDGFKIAEEDLKLRKSGEIFGKRQSGLSDLKFVDIIRDIKTIKLARDEAIKYLKSNNGKIENQFLEFDILQKFTDENL